MASIGSLFRFGKNANSAVVTAAGSVRKGLDVVSVSHGLEKPTVHKSAPEFHTSKSPAGWLKLTSAPGLRLQSSGLQISTGLIGSTHVRWHHTDLRAPSEFEDYRRKSSRDPTKPTLETEAQRKLGTYAAMAVGASVGLYYAKSAIWLVAGLRRMTREHYIAGSTEVNLTEIPEGQTKTFKWRGKPVFVRHRTQDEIAKERQVNTAELRHPQTDEERAQRPEWLVVVGVCTHLGCVPIAGKGEWGGWYCPCHGSHYDTAGRIRKGPAPLNLEVPEYKFITNDTVVIGGTG